MEAITSFFYPYSESSLKAQLKMAEHRLTLLRQKRTAAVSHEKRAVASLLAEGDWERAALRAESVVRADWELEALELLSLLATHLHSRVAQISASPKTGPAKDLQEPLWSLVWASTRVSVPEFAAVREQLQRKFGSKFIEQVLPKQSVDEAIISECVSPRLWHKLCPRPPSGKLVVKYCEAIAASYNVSWKPSDSGIDVDSWDEFAPLPPPTGMGVPMAPASGLVSAYASAIPSTSDSTNTQTNNYRDGGNGTNGGGNFISQPVVWAGVAEVSVSPVPSSQPDGASAKIHSQSNITPQSTATVVPPPANIIPEVPRPVTIIPEVPRQNPTTIVAPSVPEPSNPSSVSQPNMDALQSLQARLAALQSADSSSSPPPPKST